MIKVKRRIIIGSIIFLFLFLGNSYFANHVKSDIMSVKVLKTAEEEHFIKDGKKEVLKAQILYNGFPVVYEESSNTIYISQNLYKDRWTGKLKASNGRLKIKEDEFVDKKAEALEKGHAFTLYWYDEEAYWKYNLVFTGMPMISLKTENFENESTEIWAGTVEVYDSYRTGMEYHKSDCTFNIRGGSTRSFPKKGYKVELINEKTSFEGMRKDDDWILNSLYDDAGLIHNMTSMKVWDEITEYNTVKGDGGFNGEYAEVFINGEYNGVYLLSERIDEKELSLNKNDKLYKCRAMRIPQEHNYTNKDTDDLRPIFLLKYPKEDIEENWEPLKEWVDCFLKLDVEEYEEAEKLLNLENALDYNIFCLLIGGGDNTRKNVFFTAQYQDNGTYKFVKNPWDLNATWGNHWIGNADSNNTLYEEDYYKNVRNWSGDISTLYFMNEARISEVLYERWKELRQNLVITEEKMDKILDEQFAYLYGSGAYLRNYSKWPHGHEYWKDEYIYDYVEKRIAFLDKYFQELYDSSIHGYVYNGVDYSEEFEARYYWEKNYEILSELYDYDRDVLLEHYVHYGKPYGMQGRPDDWSQIPVRSD